MKDIMEYYREKGKQAEITLELMGCRKCNICNIWMNKEYVGIEGNCNECGNKKERV